MNQTLEAIAQAIFKSWFVDFDPVTGRSVCVKTLQSEFSRDHNERRRLLREARVTAQLQHPNTVPVYDIGDDDRQGIYFVMKRISGEKR